MKRQRYIHDPVTHNRLAAMRIVPWLISRYKPRTVLDVGCGLGTWSAVFADHGCDVLGIGERVPEELLQIPREHFQAVDLEEEIGRVAKVDLVVSLEVAEHLTESAGKRLVELLTSAGDTVLFSAAVPGQGGDQHINEQWPDYWQRMFSTHGFQCDDEVRWNFWEDEDIEWWYRQNMFIAQRGSGSVSPLRSVVHPGLLRKKDRTIEAFYRGHIPLRTAVLILLRTFASHAGAR